MNSKKHFSVAYCSSLTLLVLHCSPWILLSSCWHCVLNKFTSLLQFFKLLDLFFLQHAEFLGSSDSLFSSGRPHSKWTSSHVASCEGPGMIPGGTTGTWNNVAMFIPAIAPSRLAGCRIINLSYELKVSQTSASVSAFFFLGFQDYC